jgi:hypothetical protein
LSADGRDSGAGSSTLQENLQAMNETNKTNEPTDAEMEQFLFNPSKEQMENLLKYHKERLAKLGKTHDFGETVWADIE